MAAKVRPVIIVAGGTGGHFYPGLVTARVLIGRGYPVKFVVKRGDYVIPLLERENIPFATILAAGLIRKFHPRLVVSLLKIVAGWIQCLFQFTLNQPRAVLAMGGYLSIPAGAAAKMLGVPIILHEQNVIPGLANRILASLAKKVALSFRESIPLFKVKFVVTGNPVRAELMNLPPAREARQKLNMDPSKRTLLIFGGSQGAHRLNELVVNALTTLQSYPEQPQLIHLTGRADEGWVSLAYQKCGFRAHVSSYAHDMASMYAAADFVICRAGATTIFELIATKRPALLVPYPEATDNHQLANAKVLESLGAARVCEQKYLESGRLVEILKELFSGPNQLEKMKLAYKSWEIDPFHSAEAIADLVAPSRRSFSGLPED